MVRVIDPQDQRASYLPSTSVTFQISGNPGEALIPGTRLCGRVYLTGTGADGTKYLPTMGVHACFRSINIGSSIRSALVNLQEYQRYAAVAKCGVRPEDRFSDAGDLSSPSLSVSRGMFTQAKAAATAIPFVMELDMLAGGVFSRPLSFDEFGTITLQLYLSSAAEACIQDAGNTDASFVLTELSLAYDVAPAPAPSSGTVAPVSFIRPEVQQFANAATSRLSFTIPGTETLVAAMCVFRRQSAVGNVADSIGALEAPAGLSKVQFTMGGGKLADYEVTIADPYANNVQTQFWAAMLASGLPADTSDSVMARGGAAALRWRAADTTANAASRALAIAGVGVEPAYGIGAVFPPAGAEGTLSARIEWDGTPTMVAHLVLFFASSR